MTLSLQIRDIEFTAVCTSAAQLRSFSSSMLRGAYGNVLEWLARGYSERRSEHLNAAYGKLANGVFKNESSHAHKENAGGKPYNPYLFECESFKQKDFKPGDELKFSLILFGDFACSQARLIVTAVKLMLQGDIGGCIDSFELCAATERSVGAHYYSGGRYCEMPETYQWSDDKNISGPVGRIGLSFGSDFPLYLRYVDPETVRRLPFHILILYCLDRIEGLCRDYSQGMQKIDDRQGLLQRAEAVSISSSNLSLTGKYPPKVRGPVQCAYGDIEYAGDLTEFLPYINACSIAHIGSETSRLGWGRYRWKIADCADVS